MSKIFSKYCEMKVMISVGGDNRAVMFWEPVYVALGPGLYVSEVGKMMVKYFTSSRFHTDVAYMGAYKHKICSNTSLLVR